MKFVKGTGLGVRTAIVPRHPEIAVGTLRSILRQAGLTSDEWDAPLGYGESISLVADEVVRLLAE